jgi:hypothetical protein
MKIKLPPELLWCCPIAVPDLIRLGGKMDGGYLVPQSVVEKSQGLLSFGLGDDFTFDQDWHTLKPTDPINMYDASVTRDSIQVSVNSSARGHLDLKTMYDEFFQGNRKHVNEFIGPNNFAEALDRIGVDQVFIKMDIESSEYNLIDTIVAHRDRITGIAMEWHQCEKRSAKWQEAVEKWQEHYAIVHLHGNNHVDPDYDNMFGCMELTHIRRDLVQGNELRKQIHIPELDYSNVSGREDYEYYFE